MDGLKEIYLLFYSTPFLPLAKVVQLNRLSSLRVCVRQNYGHRRGLPPDSVHRLFLLVCSGVFVPGNHRFSPSKKHRRSDACIVTYIWVFKVV